MLSCLRVDPRLWEEIEIHQESPVSAPGFGPDTVAFECDSDWFFLKLGPFEVRDQPASGSAGRGTRSSDVEFEFDDTTNPNWKHGLILDFVELRSVVQ